jgi:3-hydroxyacyl-CoA dehydrogenase / enoyl-CoA hydratase / 3-hydroxybutyryl-CoA epimerase
MNWHLDRTHDHPATLTFDRAGTTTNTFSTGVLLELAEICRELKARPVQSLVIVSAKKNGFAAGADIEEFTSLKSPEEAARFTALGNDVFDQVANLPFPTLALVHGFCMGGGTELALACTYRVADNGDKTKMALPEVMIGIVPGWGGAKRLPRLIGAAPAMDLMLTGRSVSGTTAKKLGLVDDVTPQRYFAEVGRTFFATKRRPHEPRFFAGLGNVAPFKNLVAKMSLKQVAKRVAREHYPAPWAIVETWRDFDGDPRKVPAEHPASIQSLFAQGTARNLIRIFTLQDRLKAMGRADTSTIKRVHVVGAGVMGGDIAAWCALRGLTVTLQDVTLDRIAPAMKRANELANKKFRREKHKAQAMLDRLIPDVAGDGVRTADLIIEAIVENADIKKTLYAELEPRMKPGAILATNTSSIPLQTLAADLAHPDRLVGLHFFNPVAQMMLVEIVEGPQTSPAVLAAAADFTRLIDKLPMPCKSAPGFLVNRVLSPYLHEAMLAMDEGVPAEVIDRAAKEFGMPMGPIELADVVGLDVCRAVGEELAKQGQKVPRELQRRIDAKQLGKKSGQGFYTWHEGKAQKPSAAGNNAVDYAALADRLVAPMVNEAIAAVREGIVADGDLADAGVIFGTGFAPHRGGPVNYAKSRGAAEFMRAMEALRDKHGDRFKADTGWSTL